jgi:hypothetical protein
MDSLNTRLTQINEGKEDFYKSINKNKMDELIKGFNSSRDVEEQIFKTVSKLESIKNNHEESAFIFLKLKEIMEQQEKIELGLTDNLDTLTVLQDNIKQNVGGIKNNLNNLKERLKKLKLI